jgi:transposase InsO family protein
MAMHLPWPTFARAAAAARVTGLALATLAASTLVIFHNRARRHSALGMLTPVEFETRHSTETVA